MRVLFVILHTIGGLQSYHVIFKRIYVQKMLRTQTIELFRINLLRAYDPEKLQQLRGAARKLPGR